jgi:hypothetical protein
MIHSNPLYGFRKLKIAFLSGSTGEGSVHGTRRKTITHSRMKWGIWGVFPLAWNAAQGGQWRLDYSPFPIDHLFEMVIWRYTSMIKSFALSLINGIIMIQTVLIRKGRCNFPLLNPVFRGRSHVFNGPAPHDEEPESSLIGRTVIMSYDESP